MSEMIDLEKFCRQEQRSWIRDEAPRRSFRDSLTGSVPYWIVVHCLSDVMDLPLWSGRQLVILAPQAVLQYWLALF